MSETLVGKNALITGASRGLGRDIARALWREGANLLLVARTQPALSDVRAELMTAAHSGQHANVVTADLAEPDAPSKIVASARRIWDRVDILVNNAAVLGPIGNAWENDWDEWQATITVDLLAAVKLCRLVVPWMMEQGGGKIINLSGGGATTPRAHFSAYATAKAALVRFSETLAEEVRASNVQVNCIAPGTLNTDMNRQVLQAGADKAGTEEHTRAIKLASVKDSIPARAPELCVFLASPAANGITGKLISAVWDPWQTLTAHVDELQQSDIYTLRRILPSDRGRDWQ